MTGFEHERQSLGGTRGKAIGFRLILLLCALLCLTLGCRNKGGKQYVPIIDATGIDDGPAQHRLWYRCAYTEGNVPAAIIFGRWDLPTTAMSAEHPLVSSDIVRIVSVTPADPTASGVWVKGKKIELLRGRALPRVLFVGQDEKGEVEVHELGPCFAPRAREQVLQFEADRAEEGRKILRSLEGRSGPELTKAMERAARGRHETGNAWRNRLEAIVESCANASRLN